MIVARIEGGLGNQMFQYAFGLQLAWQNQTELVLDLSSYASGPDHGYLLNRFAIDARELSREEREKIPCRYSSEKRFILPIFDLHPGRLRRLRERPFGFSKHYLSAGSNRYVVGYWQSEKFFPNVISSVRKQFSPRNPLSDCSARIRDRMLATSSIAIHIRRGDYITSQPMSIRNLDLDYYRKRRAFAVGEAATE